MRSTADRCLSKNFETYLSSACTKLQPQLPPGPLALDCSHLIKSAIESRYAGRQALSTIFISHRSTDNDDALALKKWLECQGHTSLFLDFDPMVGIPAGVDWEQRLYRELRRCQALIVVLTPDWLDSTWCRIEFAIAREKGKAVFVVRAKPCATGPVIPALQEVDGDANGLLALARGLKEHGLDPADAFNWDSTRPIYPGLSFFDVKDAAIFFGREEEGVAAAEAMRRLRLQPVGSAKLLLITGASGSGKSSLMRAGLLARLRNEPSNWMVTTQPLRRSGNAIIELARVLTALAWRPEHQPSSDELTARLNASNGPQQLLDIARELQLAQNRPGATLLLAIDQTEELLTADDPDDQTDALKFLKLLSDALARSGQELMLVATIRSDHLGAWQQHAGKTKWPFEIFPLGPMPISSLDGIIRKPAALGGVQVDDDLVDALKRDTTTSDGLPLLAYALRHLNELHGDDQHLTFLEYKAIGRIEGAVRTQAQTVVDPRNLDQGTLEALREAFIPHLVRATEDGSFVKTPTILARLPPPAVPLLRDLADKARLLVLDSDADNNETIEIAHEALLRVWPLLRDWIEDDAAALRQLTLISRAASEWISSKKHAEYLIHRGKRLKAAESLVKIPRFERKLDPSVRSYLAACRKKETDRHRVQALITFVVGAILLLAAAFATRQLNQRRLAQNELHDRRYMAAADRALADGDSTHARLFLAEVRDQDREPWRKRAFLLGPTDTATDWQVPEWLLGGDSKEWFATMDDSGWAHLRKISNPSHSIALRWPSSEIPRASIPSTYDGGAPVQMLTGGRFVVLRTERQAALWKVENGSSPILMADTIAANSNREWFLAFTSKSGSVELRSTEDPERVLSSLPEKEVPTGYFNLSDYGPVIDSESETAWLLRPTGAERVPFPLCYPMPESVLDNAILEFSLASPHPGICSRVNLQIRSLAKGMPVLKEGSQSKWTVCGCDGMRMSWPSTWSTRTAMWSPDGLLIFNVLNEQVNSFLVPFEELHPCRFEPTGKPTCTVAFEESGKAASVVLGNGEDKGSGWRIDLVTKRLTPLRPERKRIRWSGYNFVEVQNGTSSPVAYDAAIDRSDLRVWPASSPLMTTPWRLDLPTAIKNDDGPVLVLGEHDVVAAASTGDQLVRHWKLPHATENKKIHAGWWLSDGFAAFHYRHDLDGRPVEPSVEIADTKLSVKIDPRLPCYRDETPHDVVLAKDGSRILLLQGYSGSPILPQDPPSLVAIALETPPRCLALHPRLANATRKELVVVRAGRWVVIANADGVQLWSTTNLESEGQLLTDAVLVKAAVLSPSGTGLDILDDHGWHVVRELPSWKQVGSYQSRLEPVALDDSLHYLLLQRDSRTPGDERATLVDIKTRDSIHLDGFPEHVTSALFGPDSKYLAVQTSINRLLVWGTSANERRQPFKYTPASPFHAFRWTDPSSIQLMNVDGLPIDIFLDDRVHQFTEQTTCAVPRARQRWLEETSEEACRAYRICMSQKHLPLDIEGGCD